MAGDITQSLAGNIQFALSLLNKFIDVCPDEIWAEKFGGWPVWQQAYHAVSTLDFFCAPLGAPAADSPFGAAEAHLAAIGAAAPGKAEFKAYAEAAQQRAFAYIAGLDDAALAQSNTGLAQRMGMAATHANTLALITAHTLYHLGGCDAALREHGLPGVF